MNWARVVGYGLTINNKKSPSMLKSKERQNQAECYEELLLVGITPGGS